MEGYVGPDRRRMPTTRNGITVKVEVYDPQMGPQEGYITVGEYDDGSPGEVFVNGFAKEGSTMYGLLQGFAVVYSIALQYGAPVDMLARKLAHMKFEPRGKTDHDELGDVNSLIDLIARLVGIRYGEESLREELAKIAEEMKAY